MDLSRRISLFTSALVLGMLACVTIIVGDRLSRSERARLGRDLDAAVILYREFEAERFRSLRAEAKVLSDLPQLRALVSTGDAATITDALDGLRALTSAHHLAFVDPSGKILGPKGEWKLDELLAKARAGQNSSLGYVTEQPEGGGEKVRQGIALPLSGESAGWILVAAYEFDGEILARLAKMSRAELSAFDLSGRRFAASPGAPASMTNSDLLQIEIPLEGAGGSRVARLVATRSLSEGLAVSARLRTDVFLVAASFCVFGIVASVLFARSVSRPIHELARALEGGPESASGILGADRDVRAVLEAYRRTAAELQAERERIDQEIAVRTRELQNETRKLQEENRELRAGCDRMLEVLAEDTPAKGKAA